MRVSTRCAHVCVYWMCSCVCLLDVLMCVSTGCAYVCVYWMCICVRVCMYVCSVLYVHAPVSTFAFAYVSVHVLTYI